MCGVLTKGTHYTIYEGTITDHFCIVYALDGARLHMGPCGDTDSKVEPGKRGCFLRTRFFLRKCQARPIRAHTCPGITRRLCGGLGASVAQDLRALRLWQSSRQWCAVPWRCMDAAPGCRALRRSSVNILTAWPGRVAQAPRAGRARASLVLLTMLASVSRTARLGDQLQLDDEVNSQIADGGATRKATSSLSAPQLIPE